MAESNETRPSLLVRVRNSRDQEAWGEFVEIYSPLIYGFARKQSLQDADAVDLTQDVLQIVARSIGRLEYDAARGSFRGWLFTIVRREIYDWFAKRRSECIGTGDSATARVLEGVIDSDHELSAWWEHEHEQRLFAWASERVRSEVQASTWNAFWKTTVEGLDGKSVAAQLGLSVAAVYLSKSRVMARLKVLIHQAEV